jgi:hypothetical protein
LYLLSEMYSISPWGIVSWPPVTGWGEGGEVQEEMRKKKDSYFMPSCGSLGLHSRADEVKGVGSTFHHLHQIAK